MNKNDSSEGRGLGRTMDYRLGMETGSYGGSESEGGGSA